MSDLETNMHLPQFDASKLKEIRKYNVHPCIFDDALHCSLASNINFSQLMLPNRFQEIIFHSLPLPEKTVVLTDITNQEFNSKTYNVQILAEDGFPLITVMNFRCTPMAKHYIQPRLFTKKYAKDKFNLEFLESKIQTSKWKAITDKLKEENHILDNMMASKMMKYVDGIDLITRNDHIKKYYQQLVKYKDYYNKNYKFENTESLKLLNHDRDVLLHICSNFEKFIENQEKFTELMFNEGGMIDLYKESDFFKVSAFMSPIVRELVNQKPYIKILEIGSGTGGLTKHIINKIGVDCNYTYSDISTYFVNMGKKTFGDKCSYKVIDINDDFANEEYDLVIGLDVVHAVPNMNNVLKNIYKSLKEDGVCLLMDLANVSWAHNLLFGIFKGWFLYEDNRHNCYVSETEWIERFNTCGFINVDVYNESGKYTLINEKASSHFIIIGQKCKDMNKNYIEISPKNCKELMKDFLNYNKDDNIQLLIKLPNNENERAIRAFCMTVMKERPLWNLKFNNQSNTVPYLSKVKFNEKIPTSVNEFRLEVNDDQTTTFNKFYVDDLKENEMIIKPLYSTLNFKDIALSKNLISLKNNIIGLDLSGIVTQVGKNVKEFQLGDMVFCMSYTEGTFGNSVKVQEDSTFHCSDDPINDVLILTSFTTAYHALINRAQLKKGQTVLIHSASGGLGIACIEICKKYDCEIICTTGTDEKSNWLKRTYGIQDVYNSRNTYWSDALKSKEIDIIVNSLSNKHIDEGLKIIKPLGHFIDVSKKDMLDNIPLMRKLLLKNVSYHSVHLDMLLKTKKR